VAEQLGVVPVPVHEGLRDAMWMYLGDDATGRALEVGVFATDELLLVAHVMDLRAKFRPLYEQAKAFQARRRGRIRRCRSR
jgi:hypothetical protein